MPRVLVVDDETSMARSVRRVLERSGYSAEIRADATSAVRALEDGEFELVIADFRMAGSNGLDLLLRVRRRWPRIRGILYSGFNEIREDVGEIPWPILQKPCDNAVLLATVAEQIGPAR